MQILKRFWKEIQCLQLNKKIIGKINQGRIFKRTDIHDYLQIYLKFLAAR